MDGWMDEQMGGLIDGWKNGWMDERMGGLIDGWKNGWMKGSLDRWMDRWMDGWRVTNELGVEFLVTSLFNVTIRQYLFETQIHPLEKNSKEKVFFGDLKDIEWNGRRSQ